MRDIKARTTDPTKEPRTALGVGRGGEVQTGSAVEMPNLYTDMWRANEEIRIMVECVFWGGGGGMTARQRLSLAMVLSRQC